MSRKASEVFGPRDAEEEVEEIASVAASTSTEVSRSSGSTRFKSDTKKDLDRWNSFPISRRPLRAKRRNGIHRASQV